MQIGQDYRCENQAKIIPLNNGGEVQKQQQFLLQFFWFFSV